MGIHKRLFISFQNHNFILFFLWAQIIRKISSFTRKEKSIKVISIINNVSNISPDNIYKLVINIIYDN